LSHWRQDVSTSIGPERLHDAVEHHFTSTSTSLPDLESTPEAEDDDGPDRRDSAPPVTPPVVVLVSPEQSETSSSMNTPRQQAEDLAPARLDSPSTIQGTITEDAPAPVAATVKPEITQVEVDGQVVRSPPRTPRHRYRAPRGPGSGGKWWIPDPHPAFGAEFGDRRLLVT
jgi:hypothetical protein